MNARELTGLQKLTKLLDYFFTKNVQLAFLSESWLDETFDDSHMTLFGQYQVVARQDRKKGNHGVVLVLQKVSSALDCNAINIAPQIGFCCPIGLNVPDRTVVFILVYVPPRNSRFEVSRDAHGSSDHYPILMQFDCGSSNSTGPSFSAFTFNSAQQMTVFRELCSFSFLDYPPV